MISTLDTNVLIYAAGLAPPHMCERALDVLQRSMKAGTGILLMQTLGEFSNVAVRKLGMPTDSVRALLGAWREVLPVYGTVEADLFDALEAVRDHKIQFWDAMIWAAARRLGVRYLLTEDMQDGRNLEGVMFINPFNPANGALVDEILPT